MKIGHILQKLPLKIPCFSSHVPAGFPSPADDYLDSPIDLNEEIIKNSAATFFVKSCGDSMKGAGIFDGDLIVIDRSITATHGMIILAIVDGEFTIKRLSKRINGIFLLPENPNYRPIAIKEGMDFEVWGVVTHTIHKHV